MMRGALRVTSDEDRQYFRKGIRTLALMYAGILVLLVAVTVLRAEWRRQEVTAKATDALSADLGRERAGTRQ